MAISNASAPTFNAANFVKGQEIDNSFLPYEPGTTFVYNNADGSFVDTVTVTDRTKMIDGVKCVVVLDKGVQDGQLEEKTLDYFAQDKNGNVWYFGEAATQYVNGKPVGTDGSWLAGVNGAAPGIVMEAHPKIGDSYDQENAPGVAQDHAKVISLTGSASVPFGTFHKDLLVTHETSALEPGAAENKYYAAGVGQVFGKDLVTGELERLVSVTTDDHSSLVQAMASFGANGPALDTGLLNTTPGDTGLHGMLSLHGHHG